MTERTLGALIDRITVAVMRLQPQAGCLGDYPPTITIEGLNFPDMQLQRDFTVTVPEQD